MNEKRNFGDLPPPLEFLPATGLRMTFANKRLIIVAVFEGYAFP